VVFSAKASTATARWTVHRHRRRSAGRDQAASDHAGQCEVRQDALVSELIFDIPTLIETLSRVMTLEPGDLLATRAPASALESDFNPPKYLSERRSRCDHDRADRHARKSGRVIG